MAIIVRSFDDGKTRYCHRACCFEIKIIVKAKGRIR